VAGRDVTGGTDQGEILHVAGLSMFVEAAG
jgi:hypothetical protein